jgi:Fe2+ or Zn2+ uptake regulation protein
MSDNPAELLRHHGLQVTAQRLAVLRAVSVRPHGTADDVAEFVRSEIGAISRQTVYDALGILADNGLIRRIRPAGSSARYEDRARPLTSRATRSRKPRSFIGAAVQTAWQMPRDRLKAEAETSEAPATFAQKGRQ